MATAATSSGSTDNFMTRRYLYDKMNESGSKRLEDQVKFLKAYLVNQTKCPKSKVSRLNIKISYFISDFKKRWSASKRMKERFLTQHSKWLDTTISFPNFGTVHKSKTGRPKLEFNSASERTKRYKTQNLRSEHGVDELCYATRMSLRSAGETDAAFLLKDVTTTSPRRASRYKEALKNTKNSSRELPVHEALSLFIEANLTRHQYNLVRSKDKERFPSYKKLQIAKKECYPSNKNLHVSELGAEVQLQALLDHTVSRILLVQNEVLKTQESTEQLVLLTKWGFDGSSGHSEYKQKFKNETTKDASIFMSSLVPLRLIHGDPEGPFQEQTILWSNTRSSSVRYCRPIKFEFQHETVELTKKERKYIETQIEKLEPTRYETPERKIIYIKHKMLFTMIDGKICNSITDTKSTLRCFLCGLTSKDFNNIEKCVNTSVNNDNLEFGMSTLHAWIRLFECLLHLSYKLPFKTWQVRGEENKAILNNRKKEIQNKFKTQLGLIVDKPKPGYGSSNDGNTARRFFYNAFTSSEITGVDVELITRFRTILGAMASGYSINTDSFHAYALKTAQLFVEKYSWYCMPPTVHKVLVHGSTIIKKALLPIGQLSEEAQEANNKIFKKYREGFSRKMSREKTNEDIMNRLLIASDPLITSMTKPYKQKYKIDADVMQLLEAPDFDVSGTSEVEVLSDDSLI